MRCLDTDYGRLTGRKMEGVPYRAAQPMDRTLERMESSGGAWSD